MCGILEDPMAKLASLFAERSQSESVNGRASERTTDTQTDGRIYSRRERENAETQGQQGMSSFCMPAMDATSRHYDSGLQD